MKAKALLLSGLFLALATSASAAPSTTLHTEAVPTSSSVRDFAEIARSGNFDDLIITPLQRKDEFGSRIQSKLGSGYATTNFNVAGGYGYVKVDFVNNSSSPVKILIYHTDTKKEYYNKVIDGNGSDAWLSPDKNPQGVRAGGYTISFTGGPNGNGKKPVDVTFSGYTTDIKSEVN